MTNVASLENSKKLYELSGWTETDKGYFLTHDGSYTIHQFPKCKYPAYDLGYLLRKLLAREDPDFGDEVMYYPGVKMIGEVIHKTHAIAGYWDIEDNLWGDWSEVADTPEDALTLLLIKLFEEGVLSHDQSKG